MVGPTLDRQPSQEVVEIGRDQARGLNQGQRRKTRVSGGCGQRVKRIRDGDESVVQDHWTLVYIYTYCVVAVCGMVWFFLYPNLIVNKIKRYKGENQGIP